MISYNWSIIVTLGLVPFSKFAVVQPRKKMYIDNHRNADPGKDFGKVRKAGIFQGAKGSRNIKNFFGLTSMKFVTDLCS